MTWNIAQFEVLHPVALLALALVPLVVFLGRASLLRLAGWQQRASLTVRCAVIAFLVFALCGIQWIRSESAPFVVFLVDASESVSSAGRERAKSYLGDATSSVRQDQWTKVEFDSLDENLAGAVSRATAIVLSGHVPRLVLLSDGQVQQEIATVAGSLAAPIDVVPLESITENEVYVSQIIAPASVATGLPVDVEVLIHAQKPTSGGLSFSLGADDVRREVELREGT
ncbi:MAG: hypothetical protein MI757_18520, partial [Pirellulales bacterium]|nr:hypothetical protein [Pirellulales bacterium]